MDKQAETLKELRTVVAAQQELLRIALYMMTQGPIAFSDQELKCTLEEDQARATCAVAMGAGQSLNTILRLSDDQGIGICDLYPIARSVDRARNAPVCPARSLASQGRAHRPARPRDQVQGR